MRIIRLPYTNDTVVYLDKIANEPGLIWFHQGHSHKQTEWFACWPTKTFEYLGHEQTQVTQATGQVSHQKGDWFSLLKLEMLDVEACGSEVFTGGLAGHLSYDLGHEILKISSKFDKPASGLGYVSRYDWSCFIDHEQKTATVYIQDHCLPSIIDKIVKFTNLANVKEPTRKATLKAVPHWQSQISKAEYLSAFESVQRYILEGDVYQINLTRQWSSTTPHKDWALYKQLIEKMPAPFSVFHRTSRHSLLSVSPERFIQIKDSDILTQPIKGTRPRGKDSETDQALLNDLLTSEKDRAENLMIVDLLRNDIAKNAVPGTVKVEKLFEPHSFNNVHHLVSSIKAKRNPSSHPLDVLRDAFPGGSITGAPKKRAMEIIDELEIVRRGIYCGCAFFLGANQWLDSNILIRTVTLENNKITCNGGGGIVHDSKAEEEYCESEFKIASILKALGGE